MGVALKPQLGWLPAALHGNQSLELNSYQAQVKGEIAQITHSGGDF
jgi:hypothetical protein